MVKPLNDEVKKRKKDVDILEKKLKQRAYEYEVKYQDYQYLIRERDMLKQKFYDSLFTVQQKIGLEVKTIFFKTYHFKKELDNGKETLNNQGGNRAKGCGDQPSY